MRLPPWLVAWLGWIIVVAVPPFLVLANVNLFMTPSFIYYEYGKSDFPPASRYDLAARTQYAIETVLYTRGERNDADLQRLGVYNQRELSHMRDVQNLAVSALNLGYLLGAIVIASAILLWRTGNTRVALRGLFKGSGATLVIFGALGLFAFVAFDVFFVAFHRIFFVGDSWMFLYTDSLIQFYPEPLWMDASFGIVIFTVVEAVLLAVVTGLLLRQVRKPAPQPGSGVLPPTEHIAGVLELPRSK